MEILTLSAFKRRRGGGGRGGRIWKGTVGGMAVNTTVPWQFTHEILSGCTQKLLCEVHILHFAYFLFQKRLLSEWILS